MKSLPKLVVEDAVIFILGVLLVMPSLVFGPFTGPIFIAEIIGLMLILISFYIDQEIGDIIQAKINAKMDKEVLYDEFYLSKSFIFIQCTYWAHILGIAILLLGASSLENFLGFLFEPLLAGMILAWLGYPIALFFDSRYTKEGFRWKGGLRYYFGLIPVIGILPIWLYAKRRSEGKKAVKSNKEK